METLDRPSRIRIQQLLDLLPHEAPTPFLRATLAVFIGATSKNDKPAKVDDFFGGETMVGASMVTEKLDKIVQELIPTKDDKKKKQVKLYHQIVNDVYHATYNDQVVVVKQNIYEEKYCVSPMFLSEVLFFALLKRHVMPTFQHLFPTVVGVGIDSDSSILIIDHLPLSYMQLRKSSQAFRVQRCLELVTAVREMHRIGVAHMDVKIDNVRFTSSGQLVLIDFDSIAHLIPEEGKITTYPVCTYTTRAPELLLRYNWADEKSFSEMKEPEPFCPYKLDTWSTVVTCMRLLSNSMDSVFGATNNENKTKIELRDFFHGNNTFKESKKRRDLTPIGCRMAKRFLVREPELRPSLNSFDAFLQHEFNAMTSV